MEGGRFRLVYLILVPAILVAAGILGYYTFLSAREHTQLGEQTIAQSLLSVAQQRVQRIERYIDIADHAVFRLVDPNDSSTIDTVWLPQAATQTPSVRSVLLIDQDGNLIQWASRQDKKSRRAFLRLFRQKLVKALELDSPEPHLLRHAHEQIDGKDYLLSYKAYATLAGQLTYIVAHHDTQFLVDEVFPMMFVTDETTPLYDIVDESNQLVFGPDLSEAGMYTVYHKFPTTLYRWRLQVAPQQAALLQAQGRSRMQGEVALPLMSFAIILLSAIFFIYAAEKERRLNQLKSELMANVSHELKTPLSVVRMFADMLRSGRVPSEERKVEYLDIICRESERLTSLIDNMLDFSALEGGQGPYRLKRGNIGDAVDRALDAFRYRSEQDGVEIHLERPNDLPPVMIDQEAIALAIINLLDNAVKYGGQTPVDLELTVKRFSVDIAVRDHGPGIPSDSLGRVFERFYRGSHPNPTRGSGIGLSLVKNIARAHGGRAWAKNASGGGAVVGFSIPIASGHTAG
ncbi:MAG: HAMP domain-containing histidine kinase [Deltaproteobacteria bacterium]|nr:HAMP domain-containing histidine kinase [Deltaproteobacteria bacterium]MBW2685915.1 HAMP domain-containing histidine kinase [Deltaproteobacteria bacterium]